MRSLALVLAFVGLFVFTNRICTKMLITEALYDSNS